MVSVIDIALSSMPKERRKQIARDMRTNGFEQRGAKRCVQCAEIGTLCWKLPDRSHCDKCLVDGVVCRPVGTRNRDPDSINTFSDEHDQESGNKRQLATFAATIDSKIFSPSSICPHVVSYEDKSSCTPNKSSMHGLKRSLPRKTRFDLSHKSSTSSRGARSGRPALHTPASARTVARVLSSSSTPNSVKAAVPRLHQHGNPDVENERDFKDLKTPTSHELYINDSTSRNDYNEGTPCSKVNSAANPQNPSAKSATLDCQTSPAVISHEMSGFSQGATENNCGKLEMFANKYKTYKNKCKRLRKKLKLRKSSGGSTLINSSTDAVQQSEITQLRERNKILNERVIVAEITQNLYKSIATRTDSVTLKQEQ